VTVAGRVVWRVVAPTVSSAVVGSAVAVSVNLATEWKNNLWAWLAVLVFTVISGGVALWLEYRHTGDTSRPAREGPRLVVNDAVIGGDNIQIGSAGGDVDIDRAR
jgi:ABC-type arginine/histidine transport system permease subunit